MNTEFKEKLIEIVRDNECIYNTKHKDYKNMSYKNLLWQKIAEELGVQGSKAKDTWRTLRDGYIRYRKTVKGKTGSSRKYINYIWSSQMSFLEGSLDLRSTSTNITPSQECLDPPEIQFPEQIQSPASTQHPSPSQEAQHPSPSQEAQHPSHMKAKSLSPRRKNNTEPSLERTEILEYLRNKKKKEWDSIDHLFMSYAKSFKKLSITHQSKLKVEIAKLFADAELESENILRNQHQISYPIIHVSPPYSASNDSVDLTQNIFIIESSPEQENTPETETTVALDLSWSHSEDL